LYLRYHGASDEFKNLLDDGLKGKYYRKNNLAVSEIRKRYLYFWFSNKLNLKTK
jgi:hypothetical protein